MVESLLFRELLKSVQADLRPVRPLASPQRRLLAMVPLAIALLVLPPLYWGWRINFGLLGTSLSWPLSALESAAGLALLWLSFRGSVPGYPFSAGFLRLTMVFSAGLFVAVTLSTAAAVPSIPPFGAWLRYVRECIEMTLLFALPSTLLVGWMVARALPSRPALIGAAYGLGIGMMTDAGVRLFCWVSEPAHVIVAHGGTILLTSCGGAIAAVFIERRRAKYQTRVSKQRAPRADLG